MLIHFINFIVSLILTIILNFIAVKYPDKQGKPRKTVLILWGLSALYCICSFYITIGFNLSKQVKDFTIFTTTGSIDWCAILKILVCVILYILIRSLIKTKRR